MRRLSTFLIHQELHCVRKKTVIQGTTLGRRDREEGHMQLG
jgi:hypothetical protein